MSAIPREWSMILVDAVSKPGVISEAYCRFWNYSVGNQLLAMFECTVRGIEPGPINTFLGWRDCGRHVKKGEKAITLCMPVSCKVRKARAQREAAAEQTAGEAEAEDDKAVEATVTRFIYRPHWFVLSQTEGADYVPAALPEWREERALTALAVERMQFTHTNGNIQGYACQRQVAVSPIAFAPHRTLFHEIAHVVLGHTLEIDRMEDDEYTPRNIREAEAESVALICCESLGVPGADFCRGYIQHWLSGATIPDRSAQRIFKAADQILKAGRAATEAGT
jgi:hypothetical protein